MRIVVWSALLTVFGSFWLLVLAGLPLYVFPPVEPVRPSDAVLVLGPPMEPRLALAEDLREEGVVERIVISVQASGGQTAQDLSLCRDGVATCVVADPSTTRGEVLLMEELTRGSSSGAAPSVIVVTSTPHVMRSRYIFAKCYPGEVTVVAAERPQTLSAWASQYAYQSAAFVKALLQPCP